MSVGGSGLAHLLSELIWSWDARLTLAWRHCEHSRLDTLREEAIDRLADVVKLVVRVVLRLDVLLYRRFHLEQGEGEGER